MRRIQAYLVILSQDVEDGNGQEAESDDHSSHDEQDTKEAIGAATRGLAGRQQNAVFYKD